MAFRARDLRRPQVGTGRLNRLPKWASIRAGRRVSAMTGPTHADFRAAVREELKRIGATNSGEPYYVTEGREALNRSHPWLHGRLVEAEAAGDNERVSRIWCQHGFLEEWKGLCVAALIGAGIAGVMIAGVQLYYRWKDANASWIPSPYLAAVAILSWVLLAVQIQYAKSNSGFWIAELARLSAFGTRAVAFVSVVGEALLVLAYWFLFAAFLGGALGGAVF